MRYWKFLLAILILSSAHRANADTIYLRNGQVKECRMIGSSRDSIKVEITLPSDSTLQTWFAKREIFKIEYDDGFVEYYGKEAIQSLTESELQELGLTKAAEEATPLGISDEQFQLYLDIAKEQSRNLARIARMQELFGCGILLPVVACIIASYLPAILH